MNVPLATAYAQACQLLGEAQVREALLLKIVAKLEAQIADLTPSVPDEPAQEPPEHFDGRAVFGDGVMPCEDAPFRQGGPPA